MSTPDVDRNQFANMGDMATTHPWHSRSEALGLLAGELSSFLPWLCWHVWTIVVWRGIGTTVIGMDLTKQDW